MDNHQFIEEESIIITITITTTFALHFFLEKSFSLGTHN